MGYVVGMTFGDNYVYSLKFYRTNGKYVYHSKLHGINHKHNFRYCMVTNLFTVDINGNYTYHSKFTIQVLCMLIS